MTLKALKKILDNNFRSPFLPEGMVKTAYRKTRTGKVLLALTIGRRDVGFERDGKLHDAGTFLCSPPNAPRHGRAVARTVDPLVRASGSGD